MNKRRILLSAAGVMISAVCVGAFKLAAMGVDTFQSLMSGMDALIAVFALCSVLFLLQSVLFLYAGVAIL